MALLFLWPIVLHPGWVPVRPGEPFSDEIQMGVPLFEYVRQALAQTGQLPLWNPQMLAGVPLAADPNSALWYPPIWLMFWPGLSVPLAFNVLYVAHFAWAGYGVFRFLQADGLAAAPAFFGGVAFMGTSKLAAHVGAGHNLIVAAVAWMPWFLLAVKRAAALGSRRYGALAGVCLALMFLAFSPWVFYAAPLGAALALAEWWHGWRAGRLAPLGRLARASLAGVGVFLALSAVLALPLLELASLSVRKTLTVEAAAIFSLNFFPYLLGLFVPYRGIMHEFAIYVGVVPLGLAVVSLRRRAFFWWGVVVFALAFALGTNFVLFPLFFRLMPGLQFLRVPPRIWFLGALGVACLAAQGVRVLLEAAPAWAARRGGAWRPAREARFLFVALLALSVADLLSMNSSLFTMRPVPDLQPAAAWLASQPGLFRVYAPGTHLPQPDLLQHLEGSDTLHLAAATRFIEQAVGLPEAEYSPRVPPEAANAGQLRLDMQQLGLLNVKYVVAGDGLNANGLVLTRTFGATEVYENLYVRPRAWTEAGAAEVRTYSANRLVVEAEGPGTLTVSEVAYPGWEAQVDGQTAALETWAGVLRRVPLPAGRHVVEFIFRPATVFLGGGITLAGLLGLTFILWRGD